MYRHTQTHTPHTFTQQVHGVVGLEGGVRVLHVVFGWVCVHAMIYNDEPAAWYGLEFELLCILHTCRYHVDNESLILYFH
jgi:hypothetical protein